MTPKQIDLVQETFALVAPIQEEAAKMFYNRLFEIDPSLKSLFKGDISEQGKKLMATLGMAVGSLKNPDAILPAVKKLGAGHVAYGVQDEHYGTVAEALLWTLGQGLGDKFTEEVKEAWIAVYTLVSGVMIEAAQEARAAE